MGRFSFSALAWRWLIVGHRWLGVAVCVLFVMWFATGLVLMYVGFPEYTAKERLSRLEPIDFRAVQIAPERVLHGLALGEYPRDFRLEMMNGAPVYRVNARAWPLQTLSATTGRLIEQVDANEAQAIVERVTKTRALAVIAVERDQWTVAETFEGHRPLHKISLDDPLGLELYVSSRTGEILLDTTRRERAWNWAGAVLHWLYFTELRANNPLWRQIVLWSSGIGIVVAITGLWLGIDRLRVRQRNGARRFTPFRGWMAWHHIAGVTGGVFVLTWIFSGWMSMGPPVPWGAELDARRRAQATAALAGNVEPDFPANVAMLNELRDADVRAVSFTWALGAPHVTLTYGDARLKVIDSMTGAVRAPMEDALIAQAFRLMPDADLRAVERIEREDAYWYSRDAPRTLPVLRFKYADADQTWIHVDPATGRLVGWLRQSDRIHRWLFNALHSFDYRWLLTHRPAWDVLMWALSLIGLTLSVTSIVIAWRAIRR